MSRDVVLGERIVWRGTPKVLEAPPALRAVALLLFALAAVSLCFSVVIPLALHVTPTESFVFAAWATVLGVITIQAPKIWLEKVEYIVTERHVIMQRGPFRRSIERRAISFARIRWSTARPGVGDMDLVRAVPVGALRRRLLLQLRGVVAPDRVWAIIRGVETSIDHHAGDRPLTQRLDDGERVVWSAQPRRTAHTRLPRGRRELRPARAFRGPLLHVRSNAPPLRNAKALFAGGYGRRSPRCCGRGRLLARARHGGLPGHEGLVQPMRWIAYPVLITDRRVLIQRGREELHLDCERIVDVIPTPGANGMTWCSTVRERSRSAARSASRTPARSFGPSSSPWRTPRA